MTPEDWERALNLACCPWAFGASPSVAGLDAPAASAPLPATPQVEVKSAEDER